MLLPPLDLIQQTTFILACQTSILHFLITTCYFGIWKPSLLHLQFLWLGEADLSTTPHSQLQELVGQVIGPVNQHNLFLLSR